VLEAMFVDAANEYTGSVRGRQPNTYASNENEYTRDENINVHVIGMNTHVMTTNIQECARPTRE